MASSVYAGNKTRQNGVGIIMWSRLKQVVTGVSLRTTENTERIAELETKITATDKFVNELLGQINMLNAKVRLVETQYDIQFKNRVERNEELHQQLKENFLTHRTKRDAHQGDHLQP